MDCNVSESESTEVKFYPKPIEPTTCCGRGCQGCVWESYYEALERWQNLFDKQEK